jgi:hypothetical protein
VEQASQAAEKWHLRASGVKTPDESNALTSWLKPRPTNLPTFSAACSACLLLNCIVTQTKVKRKEAEACSTHTGMAHSGSCGGAGSANEKPQRGGTLISARAPPRQGSASLHESPQLPLWATFGVVPPGLSRNERQRFDVCWRMQRNASVEVVTHGLWPCTRST